MLNQTKREERRKSRAIWMRAVHGLGKQLGLDHEALSRICQDDTMFMTPMRHMSERQLREFHKWLSGKANLANFKKSKEPKPAPYRWTKQDKMIFKRGYDLGWSSKDLRGFFRRTVGKSELKELTVQEKSQVIVGLTNVIKSKNNGIDPY